MNTVKTLKPLALVAVMSVTQPLCAAVDDDPFAGDWIYEVTVSDAAPGFSLFGVSNGTATVVGHGFPIVSGSGPYHSNVCSVAATAESKEP